MIVTAIVDGAVHIMSPRPETAPAVFWLVAKAQRCGRPGELCRQGRQPLRGRRVRAGGLLVCDQQDPGHQLAVGPRPRGRRGLRRLL
eukprot:scaffold1561_cov24-Prasinocladus_malaysianus.AAC.1